VPNLLIRDFLLGFIKLHILHHAAQGPVFGKEFKNELTRHGYEISYGTLYPVFHGLELKGYLTSKKETVNGKVRKYYHITEKGRTILDQSRVKARELVDELFE